MKSNFTTDIVIFVWFSIDNNIVKRQLVLFDVTCLPIENVPRELATCFREVLDNGGTIHVEPYGEHN